MHFSIKLCGFRIRRYDMSFCTKLKLLKIDRVGRIKIVERGQAKCLQYYNFERDYQMITVDYNRGRGVQKKLKNHYVILEQPLMWSSASM